MKTSEIHSRSVPDPDRRAEKSVGNRSSQYSPSRVKYARLRLKVFKNLSLELSFADPQQLAQFLDATAAGDIVMAQFIVKDMLQTQYPDLSAERISQLAKTIRRRPQSRHGLSIGLRFLGLLLIAISVPIFFYFFHAAIGSNFGELGIRIEVFLSTLMSVSMILLCEYFLYWKYEK